VTLIPYESMTSACAVGASVKANPATAARGRMVLMRCFVFIVVIVVLLCCLFSRPGRMAARSLGMVWRPEGVEIPT
jgi:hypothetical protein